MKKNKVLSFLGEHIAAPLIVGIICSLVTYHFTALNVEQATVDLMSRRLEIVEENDTLEEAINKLNKEHIELYSQIDTLKNEKNELLATNESLVNQLEDDTKEKEIEELQKQLSTKEQEISEKQAELDKLQEEFNKLQQEGYENYQKGLISSSSIDLSNIEVMKNQDVRVQNTGDVTVDNTNIKYYLETTSAGEAYIEYRLDNAYSEFKGKAYISKWAYENYDSDSSVIANANISIQVKLENSDEFIERDSKSGLSPDSKPAEIAVSLVGVTRLRIVFRGGYPSSYPYGPVIRLGDPGLYKSVQ